MYFDILNCLIKHTYCNCINAFLSHAGSLCTTVKLHPNNSVMMKSAHKRCIAWSAFVCLVLLSCGSFFIGGNESIKCNGLCYPSLYPSTEVSNSMSSHQQSILSVLKESALEEDDVKLKMQTLNTIVANVTKLLPKTFLPDFKNPCWFADEEDQRGLQDGKNARNSTGVKGNVKVHKEGVLRCLPYVFLLGYAKCGTTTVSRLLYSHPQFAPVKKEIQWWTKHDFPVRKNDILSYFGYFNQARYTIRKDPKNVITGDCSASSAFQLPFRMNLSTTFADAQPFLIHSILPQARLIAVVRNPIYRIRSEYYYFITQHCKFNDTEVKALCNAEGLHRTVMNHLNGFRACMSDRNDEIFCMYSYRNWIEPESPCIQLRLEATMYYHTLSQWLQYFPRERVLILRTEDLEADQKGVAASLYGFLGLSHLNIKELEEQESINKYKEQESLHKSTSSDMMYPKTAQLLYDFFHPFNVKLAELLRDDRFDWPNVSS